MTLMLLTREWRGVRPAQWELAHFAFDGARVLPVSAGDDTFLKDFVEDGVMEGLLFRGGNGYGGGQLSTHHPHSVKEGEAVRVFVGFQRGLMEASDGEVRHHEAIELLAD